LADLHPFPTRRSSDLDIATGEGSVWVTSFGFPISRIDPASNKVVQQFVGEGGDALRVGAGSVWLSNLKAGVVWRLDPLRIKAPQDRKSTRLNSSHVSI